MKHAALALRAARSRHSLVSSRGSRAPLSALPTPAPAQPTRASLPAAPAPGEPPREAHVSGIYPSAFGFVLSVPVRATEHLVPIAAASAAALAPIASALGLVRAAGGFELERVSLPTAEVRLTFVGVPDLARAKRRIAVLARDLLAVATSALPARHRLGCRPALELRSSGANTLSLDLYGDGPVATDEDAILHLAQAMLPALRRLVESDAGMSSEALVRRRIRVECRVPLDALLGRLRARRRMDAERERGAVRQALDWFGAARGSSALAAAQNDILLTPVADVAKALGQNAQHVLAEGLRHASRFGSSAPLSRFELDGSVLVGSLQLACGLERRARRHDAPSELAHQLLLGHSAEEVAQLSACVGLAAGLASVKAGISLALSGAVLRHTGEPRRAAAERRPPITETRPSARLGERTSVAPSPVPTPRPSAAPSAPARATTPPRAAPSPSEPPLSTDDTRAMTRPWAVLENPERVRTRTTMLGRACSEQTRVMPLPRQRALERVLRHSEARLRAAEPPRRAPPTCRTVPGRERR